MPFQDLTQTENQLCYKQGLREGIQLCYNKEEFLRNTTVEQIIRDKNKQREYEELFNL